MQRIKPRVQFFGDEFAKTMGIVFAENLDDLLMKVENGQGEYAKGFIHTSTLPHEGTCYYDEMWSRDAGRGVMELARLGFTEEAAAVVDYFLTHKNMGDHWGRVVNKDMHHDYEADGNTHILCSVYRTWLALGKPRDRGRQYIDACKDVLAWLTSCLASCPYGYLMPSVSELSGNPETPYPVYAVYATYGTLTVFRAFAAMAETCGMPDETLIYAAEAEKIAESMMETLVSPGDPPRVLTPRGVWLNGLDGRDGRFYELAEFGRISIQAHHWTRQLPFIQGFDWILDTLEDGSLTPVHQQSYRYIQSEMAKGYYFRKYGFVSNTCWSGMGGRHDDTMAGYGQNYFTQAALLADDVNTYSLCLKGIARLAYDGDVAVPMTFEMNPWVMHECFSYDHYEQGLDHSYGATGDDAKDIYHNPGDEGNLVQAIETLKTMALTVGITADNGVLTLKPRLPWTWDGMEVRDYPVITRDGCTERIHVTLKHERWLKKTTLHIENAKAFQTIRVRLGPYPLVLAGETELAKQFRIERTSGASWLWADKLKDGHLEVQL